MKLASLQHGRDGLLIVVSKDLRRAAPADAIVPTLQVALDSWEEIAPRLQELSDSLNAGNCAAAFDFVPAAVASPLPRAYQWADGSAYVNHVELVRKARGAPMPESFWSEPLMYQGGSDGFLAPMAELPLLDGAWGMDFEGEVAIVTDDVPLGTQVAQASGHVKLVMLANDVSLRGLIPDELAKGFGFYQSKPASAFSPVAVTPDELGAAWDGSRVHRPLRAYLNDALFGCPDAGTDMVFGFDTLIAHAARTRALGAGSIIGSGTVSNKQDIASMAAVGDGAAGYTCIAELRTIEALRDGQPSTAFLGVGDRVRLEMLGVDGQSVFGTIDQQVTASD